MPLAGGRLGAGHGCVGRRRAGREEGQKARENARREPLSPRLPLPLKGGAAPSLPLRPPLTEPQEPHETGRHGGGATPQGARRSPLLAGGRRARGQEQPPLASARPGPYLPCGTEQPRSAATAAPLRGGRTPRGVQPCRGRRWRLHGGRGSATPLPPAGTTVPVLLLLPPPLPPPQAKRIPPRRLTSEPAAFGAARLVLHRVDGCIFLSAHRCGL